MPDYRHPACILIAICLGISACTPHTDPLHDWRGIGYLDNTPVPEDIKRDAQSYFQSLGPIERQVALDSSSIEYLEDGNGRHGMVLSAQHDGERWHYAVLYDSDNRRIKVLKYSVGGYMS